jgi:transmembrane sensor
MKGLTKKYNLDNISDNSEKAIIETILSEINDEKEFLEILRIQDSSENLKNWKVFDSEKAWAEISSEINNKPKINWYNYAAVAVVLIFSVFAIRFFIESGTKYKANGATDHLVLVDGSDIVLDNGSKLELSSHFNSDNREVTLDGNAFFNVAKSSSPFTIKVKDNSITVLGTQFYIEDSDDGIRIDLIEGKVKIEDKNGKTTFLLSNQTAFIGEGIQVKALNSKIAGEGIYDDIKFDDVTVNEAIKTINAIYQNEVIVLNNDIKNIGTETIHTTIRNSSVKDFTRFMEIVFDVNVINSKGQFIISSK